MATLKKILEKYDNLPTPPSFCSLDEMTKMISSETIRILKIKPEEFNIDISSKENIHNVTLRAKIDDKEELHFFFFIKIDMHFYECHLGLKDVITNLKPIDIKKTSVNSETHVKLEFGKFIEALTNEVDKCLSFGSEDNNVFERVRVKP